MLSLPERVVGTALARMRAQQGVGFADVGYYAAEVLQEAKMPEVAQPDALDVAEALFISILFVPRYATRDPAELTFTPNGHAVIRAWEDLSDDRLQNHIARAIGLRTLLLKNLVREPEGLWCCGFAWSLLGPQHELRDRLGRSCDLLRLYRTAEARATYFKPRQGVAGVRRIVLDCGQDFRNVRLWNVPPPPPSVGDTANFAQFSDTFEVAGLRTARPPDVPERITVVV